MNKHFGFLFWASWLFTVTLAYKSYTGYQVLSTAPVDEANAEIVRSLYLSGQFDFWSRPRLGEEVAILAAPHQVEQLTSQLAPLHPRVLIPDVGKTIERERFEIQAIKQHEKKSNKALILDRFLEYDEIQAYLDEVVAMYPEIATLETIGSSYEGRPLRVLKISNGPGKTGIWFDAAVHAREWLAPPAALYSINQLTENLANNQALLDANDFFFLPVANPDGYVYTWEQDRLWRKTRSPNAESPDCPGTDGNRNYDHAWGVDDEGPCSLTYPGTAAFSESETKAVSDFLTANQNITFYVAIHTFGRLLLYPWGDVETLPPTADELQSVGVSATDALTAVRGTKYTVGTTYDVLYPAFGTSIDWAYDALGIPFSYMIELPGGGSSGFEPPPSDILPVVEETWEAFKVFANNIPASRK